jgi:hypothetical protein
MVLGLFGRSDPSHLGGRGHKIPLFPLGKKAEKPQESSQKSRAKENKYNSSNVREQVE